MMDCSSMTKQEEIRVESSNISPNSRHSRAILVSCNIVAMVIGEAHVGLLYNNNLAPWAGGVLG